MLDEEFRRRMLYVLQIWEAQADLPSTWPSMIVFAGKPGSPDFGPCALIISFFRAWARAQQGLSKQWELDRRMLELWGRSRTGCDKAGWGHGLYNLFA
eukprot:5557550-Pyramimonas_sp.AAC.1